MWINHNTCQDITCSSVFSNCTEYVRKITLQAKIADIESEQVVYPTSLGKSFNFILVWYYIYRPFLQITIINISDLLLISRRGAKFVFSAYLFIDILEGIKRVPFDTLQIQSMEIYQILL